MDDLCVSTLMRSLSAETNACFVRILVTISPRMYREALALCIHRRRPDVLLAPPWSLDRRAERFGSHVLVKDADKAGLPLALAGSVVCRVLVLKKHDRIDATIELYGTTSELRDACLEDLFGVLEEAERLSHGDGGE